MAAATKPTQGRGEVRMLWLRYQGEYLRSLRVAAGLTQNDLADRADLCNKQMISAIETGRIHCPPAKAAILAEALGVEPCEFGMCLLRWANPWLFGLIFGVDGQLRSELERADDI